MGHRIPFDVAQRMAAAKKYESIFVENNKYGYKININHPDILPLYKKYCEKIGVPLTIGLSSAQRFNFESIIFKMLEKGKETNNGIQA